MSQTEVALAGRFSEILRGWFDDETMTEIVARNEAETYDGICHSHDFCDANEAMLFAFRDVLGREITTGEPDDEALWCNAWDIAKSTSFGIEGGES